MPKRPTQITTFVRLDSYETQAVRRLQTLLMKHKGKGMSTDHILRASLRYVIKELLPEDFILGENLSDVLGEDMLKEIWKRTASTIGERTP